MRSASGDLRTCLVAFSRCDAAAGRPGGCEHFPCLGHSCMASGQATNHRGDAGRAGAGRRPRGNGRLLCNAARRETWGCQGQGSGSSTVAAAGAVARGRHWGGGGVLPLARHGAARRGRVSAGVRIGWPERRGSGVRREMHERRGRGVGGHAAAVAGVVTMRARPAVCARVDLNYYVGAAACCY